MAARKRAEGAPRPDNNAGDVLLLFIKTIISQKTNISLTPYLEHFLQ